MTLFERVLLWVSTVLVGVSGIVYAWMKYAMTSSDPYAIVHHPLQPLVLKAHILTAPLLVFAIGLVFVRHVWRPLWSGASAGRASGLVLFLTVVPMVISGTLIQTATEESWLFGLAVVHLAAGSAFLLLFGAHAVRAWMRERTEPREEREEEASVERPTRSWGRVSR